MVAETKTQSRTTWQLDPGHTLVEFSTKHMMVTTVKGRFKGVQGKIAVDEADPTRSSVEVEIDAATVDTGMEMRDNDLRAAHFLDVENYPTITFKSTRIEPLSDDHARIMGELRIRDVTREVVLDTRIAGRVKNPFGMEVLSAEAMTSIDRRDFGLTWNMALEAGGFLVGDAIRIELAIEAIKQS